MMSIRIIMITVTSINIITATRILPDVNLRGQECPRHMSILMVAD
jgi:hypothetical protein